MTELHRIPCSNVNCYILSNQKAAILIDTGRQRDRERVLSECRRYSVQLIILTHGHLDHCQNAAYLSRKLRIPIAMSRADQNLIPDNRTQPLSAHTLLGKLVLAASLKSFEKDTLEEFKPEIVLQEGDNLNEYGIPARVLELPGHTRGSIGLQIEDKLLVGDALMNMFYPTVSMLYTDEKQMQQSVERIRKLGNLQIYFGHGKPVANRNRW